jgi:hypothetical protein
MNSRQHTTDTTKIPEQTYFKYLKKQNGKTAKHWIKFHTSHIG